ncbi:MAG: helix-turn-helix domain-containing protein [Coriobacteriia bacterium]|nr:helix-turn-helix domain-containing protein [Coriobacteriia bacterium]
MELAKGDVLTAEDVAELMHFTVNYVYTLARRGDIPAVRIGHYWRFSRQSLHEWLLSGLCPATTHDAAAQ